jgi:hypothetical protein
MPFARFQDASSSPRQLDVAHWLIARLVVASRLQVTDQLNTSFAVLNDRPAKRYDIVPRALTTSRRSLLPWRESRTAPDRKRRRGSHGIDRTERGIIANETSPNRHRTSCLGNIEDVVP